MQKSHRIIVACLCIFTVLVIIAAFSDDDQSAKIADEQLAQQKSEEVAASIKREEEQCKNSLSCWGDRFNTEANIACKPILEQYPRWDYKWTSWFGIFDSYMWVDQEKLILKYLGHDIKVQNAYGAWRRANYYCIYDTINKNVIKALMY
jgi:hypothetical protein